MLRSGKMANILLMNAGSSSVKWKLFDADTEAVVAKGLVERMLMPGALFEISYGVQNYQTSIDNLDYETAARLIIEKLVELKITTLEQIVCVGHRVVAGGEEFHEATLITKESLAKIKALSDHAPLHNPMEAKYIELMQQVLPDVAQYAVFDSSFFTQMPETNAIFSLPYDLTQKYHIRRYGEHGISHDYISKQAAAYLKRPLEELKMITLHLGSGSSLAALKDGKAYDTSMGFTPLTGVTMGTRSGDCDPSIIPFLMDKLALNVNEVLDLLNTKAGLLGISGVSPDMRDLLQQKDNPRCQLALDIFVNRIVKYVGSYFVELGGTDVLVFAGGIGENNPALRAQICHQLACLGVQIDEQKNATVKVGEISPKDARIKVLVIPTNEELAMIQAIKEKLA
jgi:acetate kinase